MITAMYMCLAGLGPAQAQDAGSGGDDGQLVPMTLVYCPDEQCWRLQVYVRLREDQMPGSQEVATAQNTPQPIPWDPLPPFGHGRIGQEMRAQSSDGDITDVVGGLFAVASTGESPWPVNLNSHRSG